MSDKNEIVAADTTMIEIDGKLYPESEINPSIYFDHVKGLKNELNTEEQNLVIDNALKMMNKCKITKQTAMAKELAHQAELALRELHAAEKGFNIFINRKDIEKYIDNVEGKAIKLIELDNYIREIPDECIEKISEASDIFDKLYICFTDYTDKVAKKVAKERRAKDPIVFGAFLDTDEENNTKIYVENRLFFICDWVEEKCDLTLEELIRDVKDKTQEDITYKIGSFANEEEIKKYIRSFSAEPDENLSKIPILENIKNGEEKSESFEAPKKKRGRPKKNTNSED